MAEEKKEGKNFYQFKITRDPKRKEEIENLKAKVPFAHLLDIFDIGDEDDDEETIVSKIQEKVAAIVTASNRRFEDGATGEKKGKASDEENLPESLKGLYEAKLTDNDFDRYEEYQHKLKLNPDEEVALKEEYADVLAKKAEYDKIEKKAFSNGAELIKFEQEMEVLDQFPEEQIKNLVHFYKECKKNYEQH